MDLAAADPKGLVRESYRIEGITPGECRSILVDWALSLPVDAPLAGQRLGQDSGRAAPPGRPGRAAGDQRLSAAASRARAVIAAQSPLAIASLGATQLPPTHKMFFSAR
jgi:hypothetical protein